MIDSHVHVVSGDQARYPRRTTSALPSGQASREIEAEALLALADQEGVEKLVLVQSFAAYAYDNQYIMDVAKHHSDRVAFVCGIDSEHPDAQEQSKNCLALGASGLRALAFAESFNVESLRALLEPAAEINSAICLLATPQILGQLIPILSEYPTVPFVLDHGGLQSLDVSRPCLGAPALFELSSVESVVLKVSSRVFSSCVGDEREILRSLVSAFGSDRVMWGSDFPASPDDSYAVAVERATRATSELTSDDRDQLLRLTSERVWQLATTTRE